MGIGRIGLEEAFVDVVDHVGRAPIEMGAMVDI